MINRIDQLRQEIVLLKQKLTCHPIYGQIKTIDDLQVFMEHHVFAVWDFMSLLKSLQRRLTCIDVPWTPKGSPSTRFLINEIVTGEESDLDNNGNRTSHFELYVDAMAEAGSDIKPITALLEMLLEGKPLTIALNSCNAPIAAIEFVKNTFEVIRSNKAHLQAAVFTFGREDLIPEMFFEFVGELTQKFPANFKTYRYYLERHIEIDGEHHSHLAYRMTEELCENDEGKWVEATVAVQNALKARIKLWDSILHEIQEEGVKTSSSAFPRRT